MRLEIFRRCVLASLIMVVMALFYMQIINGQSYHEQSISNRIRLVPFEAPRGRIVDRNGVVLADNKLIYNIALRPQDLIDPPEVYKYLGQIFKKDPDHFKKIYNRRRMTPFDPVVVVENVDTKQAIVIEESKFLHAGLEITRSYQRYYPFHESSSHLIGYVGKPDEQQAEALRDFGYTSTSFIGKTGVELEFEKVLFGLPGGDQIEVNSRGRQVRLLGTKSPVQGSDIKLTVDINLQTTAMELLANRRGAVVVMDLSTGEVLTLVSSPSFDPNVFVDRNLNEQINGYFQDHGRPLVNRSISGQFPPGSVFKLPVALASIERKRSTEYTRFHCPGYLMLGAAKFGCAHVHGPEELAGAIAHSCNVYFYHLGQLVGPKIVGAYAKAFGLGRPTGIDLPNEASGRIVFPGAGAKQWFTGNTLNLSIGQGDTLTTPLQLAVLVSAIANRGVLLKPRVIKSLGEVDVKYADRSHLPKVRLKDSTWQAVEIGMRQCVLDEHGTGHPLADLKNISIYAKTGTAQAGKNQEDHAWFAGYAKSTKRGVAFCVLLEHGGSSANAVTLTRDFFVRMQDFGII